MSGDAADKFGSYGCPIILIVIVVAVGAFFGIRACERSSELQPFEVHLDEYLNIPELKTLNEAPYIIGKVITIDTEKRKIDQIYFDLPEELRATKPEEVGTVVWLKWGEEKAFRYEDYSWGYWCTCDVTIIDKYNATIVYSRVFKAGPPSTKRGGGDRSGSKNMVRSDIAEHINELPQK